MFATRIIALVLALAVTAFAIPAVEKHGISQSLMDDFMRYAQFASGAYRIWCPCPAGATLVRKFNNMHTSTQGFVARDDARHEIIVTYRGTSDILDILTDAKIRLVDYSSEGVNGTNGVKTHQGFLRAFNSVESTVLRIVTEQLENHPSYSLVSTGHSLGGALASLGGVSLASNFPDAPVQVYTFGQPRTGNSGYASLIEERVGADNIFRAVQTSDGVPTMVPRRLGYEHHTTEYWVFNNPNTNPDNVVKCSRREDPECRNSMRPRGINAAHTRYFGQIMSVDPRVCH